MKYAVTTSARRPPPPGSSASSSALSCSSLSASRLLRCALAAAAALLLNVGDFSARGVLYAQSPGAASAAGDSVESRFLEGLRQRRLFRLAEIYGAERLADPSLSPEVRADVVMQLSQNYAQRAMRASGAEAEQLWRQSQTVIDDFERQNPAHLWLPVIRAQGVLANLTRAEGLRNQAEVAGFDPQKTAAALTQLRQVIGQLRQQDERLAALLAAQARSGETRGGPARHQLLNLQRQLQFQLGRAYRSQGECYPAASPDRDNALRQALDIFEKLSRQTGVDNLVWESWIEEIRCQRLKQDYTTARRRLEQLAVASAPSWVRQSALAQAIWLDLDERRISEALRWASQRPQSGSRPELDIACLAAYLQGWSQAQERNDARAAQDFEARAGNLARQVQRHDPYWVQLADALTARTTLGLGQGGDVALLERGAQSLYRSGQVAAAVTAFDKAVAQAKAANQPEQAFSLAYTAAAIEQQREQYASAGERFRRVALEQPRNPQAPDAHLLAIFNMAQVARRDPQRAGEYLALLDEHLAAWPTAPSSDHARWYLGRVHESRRQWREAIAVYRGIRPDHEQYSPSLAALGRCYEGWIAQQRDAERSADGAAADSPDVAQLAREAARMFEQVFVTSDGRFPERWSEPERQAALAAARMRLAFPHGDYDRAGEILLAALDRGPHPDEAWKAAAQAALAVAHAGQRRFVEADARLATIPASDAALLLWSLDTLQMVAVGAPADVVRRVGQLQIQAAKNGHPHRDKLDADQRKRFDTRTASALARTGDVEAAVRIYVQLALDHPKDGDLQEELALLQISIDNPASITAGLERFRDIDRKSRNGSPRWFRAKYHMAEAHLKLGNRPQAEKIVEVTRVLHPEMGGPEMKARFDQLLK